jgi:hypothetical protein
MTNRDRPRFRCLEGRHVSVALADGSRIDDCELVSVGHQRMGSLWIYANGTDLFVPPGDVLDLWESVPPRVPPRPR